MAKDFNNRLITPELEKAMQDYPLYSQDSRKKDAVCIAVFFIGNARWYILEGQRENDDIVLFGIVVGLLLILLYEYYSSFHPQSPW